VDPNQLKSRGKGLSTHQLNLELQKALEDGVPVTDTRHIASKSRIANIHALDVVQEALREDYQVILYCAQTRLFLDWKDPEFYHWFYARSFGMPWFVAELWSWAEFDWEQYFDEILRADNVELFKHAREHGIGEKVEINPRRLWKRGAAKIMTHLGMPLESNDYSIENLVRRRMVNILRQLHGNGVDIFKNPNDFLMTCDPDVLDFILSVHPRIVDISRVVNEATSHNRLDLLKVLFRHLGKVPLNQAQVTQAASYGRLEVVEWACSINPELLPTKECLLSIMARGHAKMFTFLYQIDPRFLPEPYHAEKAELDTMWCVNMIARLYDIDPALVPLMLLYRHAMELDMKGTAFWLKTKMRETWGNGVVLTAGDVDFVVASEDWAFVRLIAEKDPTLRPSGKTIRSLVKDVYIDYFYKLERNAEFWHLVAYLYEQTKSCEYLPTAKELRHQSVERVKWAHSLNGNYLSRKDFMKLCVFGLTGTEIIKWIAEFVHADIACTEMANMAAKYKKFVLLNWIITKNPLALPVRNLTRPEVNLSDRWIRSWEV
jgi:hypothetical protein